MFLKEFVVLVVSYAVMIIFVLVGVAFFTLLERKILGYVQIRKGPNKIGLMGFLQPFSDAVKLFCKECTYPSMSNYLVYYFSPVFSFFLIIFLWCLIPYYWGLLSFNFGIIFFMVVISFGVYSVMISGWSSNSNYSLLGGLRSVAQTISYEISLGFILICVLIMMGGYNLSYFYKFQDVIWFFFLGLFLFMMMFVTLLGETNRTPFDLAEGESELVSGFNVEYSSGGFSLIFLAEYGSIMFMSLVISLFFFGGDIYNFFFFLSVVFMMFIFVWVRGTLPRFRYDHMMFLCWKSFLPLSLNLLGLFLFIYVYMYMNMY
uniref:NADH-ubiquinone oxidoreductase chain 1 n=1 Tax=Stimulopalpus japonicus TaxID=209965 RepID=A0A343QCJ9_9NEOP|nr:NADH dehydrogenase subunit 1 [Stimulopalpus japonicus]ATU07146.1 NADH dehydrogenase subunit 1 [Stimulopalpus japonicus]